MILCRMLVIYWVQTCQEYSAMRTWIFFSVFFLMTDFLAKFQERSWPCWATMVLESLIPNDLPQTNDSLLVLRFPRSTTVSMLTGVLLPTEACHGFLRKGRLCLDFCS